MMLQMRAGSRVIHFLSWITYRPLSAIKTDRNGDCWLLNLTSRIARIIDGSLSENGWMRKNSILFQLISGNLIKQNQLNESIQRWAQICRHWRFCHLVRFVTLARNWLAAASLEIGLTAAVAVKHILHQNLLMRTASLSERITKALLTGAARDRTPSTQWKIQNRHVVNRCRYTTGWVPGGHVK